MKNRKKSWTVLEIIKTTTDFLEKKEISNPRLNSERLLSYLLKIDRVQLYIQFERVLTTAEVDSFRVLVQRRAAHEPLQYILGETEFMGLPYKVNKDVLIPRPETEMLVEKILELKENFGDQPVTILDVGTGSGCIAISIAKNWSECQVLATDISDNSLKIAQENADLNNVANQVEFKKHDILTADSFPLPNADIVVSNPPYIGKREMEQLDPEIINYEPLISLTDNDDGTLFYQKILSLIANGFQCKFIFMELNANQPDKILNIAKGAGFRNTSILRDLNNLPRILKIRIN